MFTNCILKGHISFRQWFKFSYIYDSRPQFKASVLPNLHDDMTDAMNAPKSCFAADINIFLSVRDHILELNTIVKCSATNYIENK